MARRLWFLAACAGLLVSFYLYTAFEREQRYRALVAAGDEALAHDQTFHAIESYSGAIALKPKAMLGYLKRGETYRRRGEPSPALRDLKQAADLDAAATRPQELVGDLLFEAGRYARAAEHYGAYVRLDDRAPRVLYKLAAARYRNGESTGALAALNAAIALDERFAEAHYLLGIVLRSHAETTRAERELRRALALQPSLVAAKEELAELLRDGGRETDALAIYEELLADTPASARRQVAAGEQYARMGRIDDAVVALSRASEMSPDYPLLYYKVGRLWMQVAVRRNDRIALNKALAALRTSARRNPHNSTVLAALGEVELLAGDRRKGEEAAAAAAAETPTDPAALRLLADILRRQGRLNEARDALRRFELLAGPRADVDIQVAELSEALRDHAAAAAAYRHASERHQDDLSLYPRLVQALARSGKHDEAVAACREGLERAPSSPVLKRLWAQLGRR